MLLFFFLQNNGRNTSDLKLGTDLNQARADRAAGLIGYQHSEPLAPGPALGPRPSSCQPASLPACQPAGFIFLLCFISISPAFSTVTHYSYGLWWFSEMKNRTSWPRHITCKINSLLFFSLQMSRVSLGSHLDVTLRWPLSD